MGSQVTAASGYLPRMLLAGGNASCLAHPMRCCQLSMARTLSTIRRNLPPDKKRAEGSTGTVLFSASSMVNGIAVAKRSRACSSASRQIVFMRLAAANAVNSASSGGQHFRNQQMNIIKPDQPVHRWVSDPINIHGCMGVPSAVYQEHDGTRRAHRCE